MVTNLLIPNLRDNYEVDDEAEEANLAETEAAIMDPAALMLMPLPVDDDSSPCYLQRRIGFNPFLLLLGSQAHDRLRAAPRWQWQR